MSVTRWSKRALAVLVIGCGANGHLVEDSFQAWTDDELEAKNRIRHWVAVSETLFQDEGVPEQRKAELRRVIADARAALAAYDEKREQGQTRGMIIAPIQVSAAGIVADDATGVGVADDVVLVPLALAAIATYALTDAKASANELARAWNDVLARVAVLGTTVADITSLAANGRVADTGIVAEMYELIRARRWKPDHKDDKCRALEILLAAARTAGDTKREKRIETTQKALKCRRSRQSRE